MLILKGAAVIPWNVLPQPLLPVLGSAQQLWEQKEPAKMEVIAAQPSRFAMAGAKSPGIKVPLITCGTCL